jgi:flagellar capping protein FliD
VKRLVIGGLAALGIVGGTASVVYNHNGDATVKVTENGVTRTVKVGGSAGGPEYSCPQDVVDKQVTPTVKLAGRIKLTLHDVETQLDPLESQIETLETRYPSGEAPDPVVTRYNSLRSRYNSLFDRAKGLQSAYNKAIAKHNTVMAQECERE